MSFSLSEREFYLAETHGIQHAREIIAASHGNGAGAPMTDAERAETTFGPEDVLDAYGSARRGGLYELALGRDIARTIRTTNAIPAPDYASVGPATLAIPAIIELPGRVA